MPKSNYATNGKENFTSERPAYEIKAQAEYVSQNLENIYNDYVIGRSLEFKKIIESDETMENVKNIMMDYATARNTWATLYNWNDKMKTGVL
jgi:hypothetical protein